MRSVLGTNRLVRGHYHHKFSGLLTHVHAALDHQGTSLTPGLWLDHAATVEVIDVPFRHPQLTSPDATRLIAPELARRLAALDATRETNQ